MHSESSKSHANSKSIGSAVAVSLCLFIVRGQAAITANKLGVKVKPGKLTVPCDQLSAQLTGLVNTRLTQVNIVPAGQPINTFEVTYPICWGG